MKRHLKNFSKRRNRSRGRLASIITIMEKFHSGYFKSAREVRDQPGWKAGHNQVGLASLWLQYRTPRYYKGIFTIELARIKCRFIKEES